MKKVNKMYLMACIFCTSMFLLGSSPATADIMYSWEGSEGRSGSFSYLDQSHWGGEVVNQNTIPTILTSFEFTINPTWGLTDVDTFQFTAFTGVGMIYATDGTDILNLTLSGMGGMQVYAEFSWNNDPDGGKQSITFTQVEEDGTPIPEPTTGLLLGIALVGLVGAGAVRKIKQKKAVANT